MENRHSVRAYKTDSIEGKKRQQLNQWITSYNQESGLHIQIFYDEPTCFDTGLAHYGHFENVRNYICLVGTRGQEKLAGYYGEKLVLNAQAIGLNTCWVALTHGKSQAKLNRNEKVLCIIAIGYGQTQGVTHKSKQVSDVSNYQEGMPTWFLKGVQAALLAPTAVNQQKFYFTYKNGDVSLKVKGLGAYTKIDLGIVQYHFELGSGQRLSI